MRRSVVCIFFLLCIVHNALAWERAGHDAICYIAEQNLTPKAKKTIGRYLDGKSIVAYSSWMDDVRATPEYRHTDRWHSAFVDENNEPCLGSNFKEDQYAGDAVVELQRLVNELKDWKAMSDSAVVAGIKIISHLVGDMHCPGHVKYLGVKGFKVIHKGKEESYHHIWDEVILEYMNKWSFIEYGYILGHLDKKQIRAITKGSIVDWERGNAADCRAIYEWARPGDNLDKDFFNKAKTLADSQIQKAGYRLAYILNSIFG